MKNCRVHPTHWLISTQVKVGAKCKVPWGDSSDEYDAEVVALHSSAAVRLHYLTVGSDWDQWVGRRKIIRQLRA